MCIIYMFKQWKIVRNIHALYILPIHTYALYIYPHKHAYGKLLGKTAQW